MKTRFGLLLVVLLLSAPAGRGGAQEPAPTDAPAETEEELVDFVPSEEVPADTAISFPVDI